MQIPPELLPATVLPYFPQCETTSISYYKIDRKTNAFFNDFPHFSPRRKQLLFPVKNPTKREKSLCPHRLWTAVVNLHVGGTLGVQLPGPQKCQTHGQIEVAGEGCTMRPPTAAALVRKSYGMLSRKKLVRNGARETETLEFDLYKGRWGCILILRGFVLSLQAAHSRVYVTARAASLFFG